MAVIPGTAEDEVWISVARTLGEDTVRYVEQLQPRVSVDEEDDWYLDSALQFDGGDPVNITAIDLGPPIVITAVAHGRSNGDNIYIAGITIGPTELNGNYYEVQNVTDDTFEVWSL